MHSTRFERCRYSHVLKTDDDCYVRVAKLVHLVRKLERDGQGMLYIGRQVIDVNCDFCLNITFEVFWPIEDVLFPCTLL